MLQIANKTVLTSNVKDDETPFGVDCKPVRKIEDRKMKKLRKEYAAEFQFNNHRKGKWFNTFASIGNKRYYSTKEEAQDALRKVIGHFNNRTPGEEIDFVGDISISSYVDQKTISDLTIVKTRIRVREVTEWEEC